MNVTLKYLSFKSSLSIQRDIEVIIGQFVENYYFRNFQLMKIKLQSTSGKLSCWFIAMSTKWNQLFDTLNVTWCHFICLCQILWCHEKAHHYWGSHSNLTRSISLLVILVNSLLTFSKSSTFHQIIWSKCHSSNLLDDKTCLSVGGNSPITNSENSHRFIIGHTIGHVITF